MVKLANQFQRGGLDGEEAVRSGFERATFDALGLDDAAQARTGFDDGAQEIGKPYRTLTVNA